MGASLTLAAQLRCFFLERPSTGDGAMTSAMRHFTEQMCASESSTPIEPSQLLKTVSERHAQFVGRSQQDSQEVRERRKPET